MAPSSEMNPVKIADRQAPQKRRTICYICYNGTYWQSVVIASVGAGAIG